MTTITGGTWTYTGNPATDTKDAIRFLCTDTDTTNQLLSDEEILFLYDQYRDIYAAAGYACIRIASSNKLVDKKVGDLELKASTIAQGFRTLARELQSQAYIASVPFAGGISRDARQVLNTDTDREPPSFTVGEFDNPNNPQRDSRQGTWDGRST